MTLLRSIICLLLLVSSGALFGLDKAPNITLAAKTTPAPPAFDFVELLCYSAGAVWILLAGWVGVLVFRELGKKS